MGKTPEKDFFKEDIQMTKDHEKMLNITHHQGNANQNDNDISFYTCQNCDNQKHKK